MAVTFIFDFFEGYAVVEPCSRDRVAATENRSTHTPTEKVTSRDSILRDISKGIEDLGLPHLYNSVSRQVDQATEMFGLESSLNVSVGMPFGTEPIPCDENIGGRLHDGHIRSPIPSRNTSHNVTAPWGPGTYLLSLGHDHTPTLCLERHSVLAEHIEALILQARRLSAEGLHWTEFPKSVFPAL
jgi:hypothetical protein